MNQEPNDGHSLACLGYDENDQVYSIRSEWGEGWEQSPTRTFGYRYIRFVIYLRVRRLNLKRSSMKRVQKACTYAQIYALRRLIETDTRRRDRAVDRMYRRFVLTYGQKVQVTT